jgi:hypothetical protein
MAASQSWAFRHESEEGDEEGLDQDQLQASAQQALKYAHDEPENHLAFLTQADFSSSRRRWLILLYRTH